ncbi:MAG: hypothetical protein JOZ99_10390, partial [Actinobacteria bacterium]|nr:hypothetical protein [Actinomycetota bacterium]
PNGDLALLELRVRDVGTSHTPLVGSYERYGWNHPGPLLFYLYALPYRVFGSQFAGIQIGALLVAAASVVVIALVAWRRGGVGLLVWILLLTTLLAHGVPGRLTDPWEPNVLVLAVVALVFVTYAAIAGERWALPVTVVFGTLIAQASPTVLVTAIVLVVVAAVGVLVRIVRNQERGWLRAIAASGVLLVATWIPPAIDVLIHHPNNLGLVLRWFRQGHATIGLGNAYRMVALQFGVPAPWMGGAIPKAQFTTTVDFKAAPAVPIALLAVAAAIVFSARRREPDARFVVTALVAAGATIVGASRLVGPIFIWIPQPTRGIGMVCWAAGGWCLYQALPPRHRARFDGPALATLGAALVAVVAVNTVAVAGLRPATDARERALLSLRSAGVREARRARGPILLRSRAPINAVFGGAETDVEIFGLALVRKGVDVVVDPNLGNRFGEFRAHPQRAVEEFLILGRGTPLPPQYREIASVDPLTPQQHAARARLTARLEQLAPGATQQQILHLSAHDARIASARDQLDNIPDEPVLVLAAGPPRARD